MSMNARNTHIADVPLVATAVALSLFGICMVYSAGETDMRTVATGAWQKQLVWFMVALGVG